MKTFKLFTIIAAALLIGIIFAGCASMQLISIDESSVQGPRQVRQGQDINPREIIIMGNYKDGSYKSVPVSQSNITFNKHTPGLQTVTVRVSRQAVTFVTEVMALRTLTVSSPPRIALFKEGQDADPSWPGLEIRGEWDQMGSDRIDLSYCEITGYNKNQPGRQIIRVSYEGLTVTFEVDVRSMSSIEIVQIPRKLDYFQGDSLDLTGLTVKGVWGDGIPDETLTITRADVTGFNPERVGIQPITVTKNGRTAIFNVEVLGLTSLELDKPPTKTTYYAGEPLNLTGIMLYGNYTGADPNKKVRVLIPVEQLTDVSGYDPYRVMRQQRITITVRGIVVNFFVDIEAPQVLPQ